MAKEKQDILKLKKALIKKAMGYSVEETTEEYSLVDNDLVLIKKKTTTKDYPPDLPTIKYLLGEDGEEDEYKSYTKEELEKEKERLLNMLKENEGAKNGN